MDKRAMLLNAISSHIHLLYGQIDGYRRQRNTKAIKDCYNEIHKYEELKKLL